MKSRVLAGIGALAVVSVSVGFASVAMTARQSQAESTPTKAAVATMHARGTFEVTMTPRSEEKGEGATLGRMSIEKKVSGDLDAVSKGEMLSAVTSVKGSAGYVALERVEGALHGKVGTFVLQHTGTMTRGEQQLSVTVVPDSATGELVGLAGKFTIKIAEGKHSYDFEYTLADAR